jgi:hypothetical protein
MRLNLGVQSSRLISIFLAARFTAPADFLAARFATSPDFFSTNFAAAAELRAIFAG